MDIDEWLQRELQRNEDFDDTIYFSDFHNFDPSISSSSSSSFSSLPPQPQPDQPTLIHTTSSSSSLCSFTAASPVFRPGVAEGTEENIGGLAFLRGNKDLSHIFFEWLQKNKDHISAEDFKSIRFSRSTIQAALKQIGTSAEGQKKLLNHILQWIEQHYFHNRRMEGTQPPQNAFQNQNPNPNFNLNSISVPPQNPNPYLWMDSPPVPVPGILHGPPTLTSPPPVQFEAEITESGSSIPMVDKHQPRSSALIKDQARKKRMKCHRGIHSSASSTAVVENGPHQQGLHAKTNLKFLLQKVLKQSDVGHLGRIVLPKKAAEFHLPKLQSGDGITIRFEEFGSRRVWDMHYRFWLNNNSRMYLLESTGEFVRENKLEEGDFILLYQDIKCGNFFIRSVKMGKHGEQIQSKNHVKRSHRDITNAQAFTDVD